MMASSGPMFERLPEPGRGMIAASWIGTAVFTVTAVLSAATSAMRAVGVHVCENLGTLGELSASVF